MGLADRSSSGIPDVSIIDRYTIFPKVLGRPLLMKGLTTLVISMSTNLNV